MSKPASGNGTRKGPTDGVSASPGGGAEAGGRTPAGKNGGGFMGRGGYTEIDYHGGGQAGEDGNAANVVTGGDSSDGQENGASTWTAPTYEPHAVTAGGHRFGVVETSGIASAELLGSHGAHHAVQAAV